MPLWDIVTVILLILLNGFFAMSELAVVSSRKARLQVLAEEGRSGARRALRLAEDPGRFLSTVQIGITLIGIFAGAFGGTRLAGPLAGLLERIPFIAPYSAALALGLVVAGITYLSLIIGELLPKQLALRNAEKIAAFVARPMALLEWLAGPLVTLLDVSTELALRLVGRRKTVPAPAVTDQEIKMLIAEATRAGVVKPVEREMIEGVMRLADRPVGMIMTPRPDVVWLDLEDQPTRSQQIIRESGHSFFPVGRGSLDELQGIVQVQDLLGQCLGGQPFDIQAVLHEPLVVPESVSAVQVMDQLKKQPHHVALVMDEYGTLQGLISSDDILESIIGELPDHGVQAEPEIVQREDGSWLLDGGLPADETMHLLGWRKLPVSGGFNTLAGLVLTRLGRVPAIGEVFTLQGYRFEVVDMDGRRIDRVLVSREAVPSSQSNEKS